MQSFLLVLMESCCAADVGWADEQSLRSYNDTANAEQVRGGSVSLPEMCFFAQGAAREFAQSWPGTHGLTAVKHRENKESEDENLMTESPRKSWSIPPGLLAILLLAALIGSTYLMTWAARGAGIFVEADKSSQAVLSTGAVLLKDMNGPAKFALRAGAQRVRSGTYAIEVETDSPTLVFSTGKQFTVKPGDELRIKVTAESEE